MIVGERIVGLTFVLAAVVTEAMGQLAFKRAADQPEAGTILCSGRGWLSAGIGIFAVEGLLWTCVLKYLPVSIAQPAGSLELIVVAILSRQFLKERLSSTRLIGVAMILAGVVMVSVF